MNISVSVELVVILFKHTNEGLYANTALQKLTQFLELKTNLKQSLLTKAILRFKATNYYFLRTIKSNIMSMPYGHKLSL